MAADFANRWRESVGFRIFIDEIENRLLAFGEHDMTYTEQVFGSQAGISNCFFGRHDYDVQPRCGADFGGNDSVLVVDSRWCVAHQHDPRYLDRRQLQDTNSGAVSRGSGCGTGPRRAASVGVIAFRASRQRWRYRRRVVNGTRFANAALVR